MQHEPRPAIHMEKQLGWAYKLGVAESLVISKVGHTVSARLSLRYGTSLPALWREGLEKGQWPLLALISDTSVSPCMLLVTFKLPLWFWGSEGASLSR